MVGIDHVVVLVNDLAEASRNYSALGFTVVPGGTHADGATHNALVLFADGTYIELLAFLRPAPEHRWWHNTLHGEGLIEWALLADDVSAVVAAATAQGLALDGPHSGGRQRPDGQRIAWQMAFAQTPDLPFLLSDVTPRTLRVPDSPTLRQHPNGARGIAGLTVAVTDVATSVPRYRALVDSREPGQSGHIPPTDQPQLVVPELGARIAVFPVGRATVMLAEPRSTLTFTVFAGESEEETALNVQSKGPLTTYLLERGEGLYGLALRMGNERTTSYDAALRDPLRSHGVRLELIPEAPG